MMSAGINNNYPLAYIQAVEFYKDVGPLDSNALKAIRNIASQVGAPSYNKTPVFKNKGRNMANHSYQNGNNHKNKGQMKMKYTDDNWAHLRNWEETQLAPKKEGLELLITQIRSDLNKMTKDTYEEMRDLIMEKLASIGEDDHENKKKVALSVFETATTNSFWSSLYSKLYYEISEKYPIYKEICMETFEEFLDIFETIEYVDPDKDYDKFCQVNKTNEKRRAMGTLFVGLCEQNMIEKSHLVTLINNLFDKIYEFMDQENKIQIIEEISENLKILVLKSKDLCQDVEGWDTVLANVERVANFKARKHIIMTNKIIFTILDVHEAME